MPTCANPRCGAEFTPRRKDQQYCAVPCGRRHRAALWKIEQRTNPETADAFNARQAELARANRADPVKGDALRSKTNARNADPERRAALNAYARARVSDPVIGPAIRAAKNARNQIAIYGQPTETLMQTKDRFRHARALGFRSGLEVKNARHLEEKGATFEYEPYRLPYVKPERNATFTPDFCLPNGVIIDTKGLWDSDDRAKFALVKGQHPDLDIRMVFTNPNAKISKGSKTSYADVCQKIGLPFAKDLIPTAWLQEPPNEASLAAIERLRK